MGNEKYCLVLSGGGAKGVYHIGAWRALRELGVEIEGVVGNSIGAIIATFIALNLHAELEDIGSKIGLDYILNVPEELVEDGELSINLRKKDAFRTFYRNTASKRGLDTSPLKNLLSQYIDEERIRNGDVDFGVVTYNVSDMKPREVFLEEMEEGELISYAMASSAFPGFQSPEIAGKKYIDGGVFDNIPFSMARSRGYRNLIIIDISGAGVNRKPDIPGTRTTYIKNSINMGGVLDFDRQFLDDFNTLGYLDTMKTFGRLRGVDYFIEPDEKMESAFIDFMNTESIQNILITKQFYLKAGKKAPQSMKEAVRRMLPKNCQYDPNWLPILAECAAESLAVNRVKKWTYRELFDEILSRESTVREEAEDIEKAGAREFSSRIRRELKDRKLLSTPYTYHMLGDHYLNDRLKLSLEKLILRHYPELVSGVFFLEILEEFQVFTDGARV